LRRKCACEWDERNMREAGSIGRISTRKEKSWWVLEGKEGSRWAHIVEKITPGPKRV